MYKYIKHICVYSGATQPIQNPNMELSFSVLFWLRDLPNMRGYCHKQIEYGYDKAVSLFI